jgi:magnesium transporter
MRVLTAIDRDEIAALRDQDEYVWVDLVSPAPQELEEAIEVFEVHELAAKSLREDDDHPWLEVFEDSAALVFYGVSDADDVFEVEIVVTGDYLLTVRNAACTPVDQVRGLLSRRQPENEAQAVHRVLDALADSFLPALTAIENEIDDIEDEVLKESEGQVDPRKVAPQILELRHKLVRLRKVILPMRDMFARSGEDIAAVRGLSAGTRARDYFLDIYADLVRLSQSLDAARDLLTSLMDVHLSTVSNRTNDVMKQLTIVATIFLPLAFVTGFFGQNFRWLVDHVDTFPEFLLFGGGGLIVPVVTLLVWFRRSRYL